MAETSSQIHHERILTKERSRRSKRRRVRHL